MERFMFYAYRLNDLVNRQGMFHPTNDFSECAFSEKSFLKLIKNIGWDETWTGKFYTMWLPTVNGMPMQCRAIQEQGLGRWFLGSPVALTYLDGLVDWDGRTDSQELRRTIEDIQGDKPLDKGVFPKLGRLNDDTPRMTRGWRKNDKGNLTAAINGLNVCVLKSKYGTGFVGMIFGGGDDGKKAITPTLLTEQAVADYLLNNFNKLIKDWYYDAATKAADADEDEDDDGSNIVLRPF
jgi:hypothetical protein